MRWISLSIAGLIFLPGIAKANVFDLINQESRINSTIESTTKFLLTRWASNEELNKHQPPQVLPLPAGSKVYGACGERVTGDEVLGSSYCSSTNTFIQYQNSSSILTMHSELLQLLMLLLMSLGMPLKRLLNFKPLDQVQNYRLIAQQVYLLKKETKSQVSIQVM